MRYTVETPSSRHEGPDAQDSTYDSSVKDGTVASIDTHATEPEVVCTEMSADPIQMGRCVMMTVFNG